MSPRCFSAYLPLAALATPAWAGLEFMRLADDEFIVSHSGRSKRLRRCHPEPFVHPLTGVVNRFDAGIPLYPRGREYARLHGLLRVLRPQ